MEHDEQKDPVAWSMSIFPTTSTVDLSNRDNKETLVVKEDPARATTPTSESERQSGRLGVWLYSSHTRARVAQGEEREPASSEPVKPELKP